MANQQDITDACKLLSIAFPKMEKEFFALLTGFILKNQFTKQRLKDAINHVIGTFKYKEISIAEIISFDSQIRLYTYKEVLSMVDKGYSMSDFEIIHINDKTYRRLK